MKLLCRVTKKFSEKTFCEELESGCGDESQGHDSRCSDTRLCIIRLGEYNTATACESCNDSPRPKLSDLWCQCRAISDKSVDVPCVSLGQPDVHGISIPSINRLWHYASTATILYFCARRICDRCDNIRPRCYNHRPGV